MSVKKLRTSLGSLTVRGTVLVQRPWHCLQEEVARLGLQVEQITFPADCHHQPGGYVHAQWQWIQECMLVAQHLSSCSSSTCPPPPPASLLPTSSICPPPHPATVLPIPTPVSPPTGRGRRDCWLSCPHRLGGVNCITVKRHDEPRCLPGQEHAGEGSLISLQFRGWWRHGVKTAMLGVERGQGMEGTTNLGMATRTVERMQTVSVGWSVYCLVTPVP